MLLLLRDDGAGQTRAGSARRLETYESVVIAANGSLAITTADQKIIVVPMQGEQSSFSEPVVVAFTAKDVDGRAVARYRPGRSDEVRVANQRGLVWVSRVTLLRA